MKTLAGVLSVFMFFSIVTAATVLAEQQILGPPLAQSLVREGTLAMDLSRALKIGSPVNEADAESALSAAGIAPRNGWVGDYPVTPDVVLELRESVGSANAKGLSMSKGQALTIFDSVMKDYELPVSAAGPAVNSDTWPGTGPLDPTMVNNYYAQEGPPVVTYFSPPADYSYLYNYVPYPFWWMNTWFGGYYLLSDFSFPFRGYGSWHHGYWAGHGYGYGGRYGRWGYSRWRGQDHDGDRSVSNHFRHGGTTDRIDPANRVRDGFINDGTRAEGQRRASLAALNSALASRKISYSGNRSFNRPAQWASHQTRQNTYRSGRARGVHASFVSNRGQHGAGGRSISGGRVSSRGSSRVNTSSGQHHNSQGGRR